MKKRRSAWQQLYESLKQRIVSGAHKPGDILGEAELAKQFGVSRTPVREALSLLEKEGLVRRIPYRGYLVTELTIDRVLDIIQMRIILEREAVRLAAGRIQPDDIDELERVQNAGLRGEIDPMEADRRFHQIITRKAGNELLAEFLTKLYNDLHRLVNTQTTSLSIDEVLWGHEETIDALRRGDVEAASASVIKQLSHFQDMILRRL